MNAFVVRHPWIPYVLPFAAFMALLAIAPHGGWSPRAQAILRTAIPLLLIVLVALPNVWLRVSRPASSVAVGIIIFLIWIAPDQLIPGYRSLPLFQNGIVGHAESSVPVEARTDPVFLTLRFFRAVVVVAIVEELFWRGWVPRWIDRMEHFEAVPLGTFSRRAFVVSTVLFAVEHGSFWDVGLLAGAGYNWWMVKTKSLGDLALAHAVTNGCLGAWVLTTGQWMYW